jgi:hypothetical protein
MLLRSLPKQRNSSKVISGADVNAFAVFLFVLAFNPYALPAHRSCHRSFDLLRFEAEVHRNLLVSQCLKLRLRYSHRRTGKSTDYKSARAGVCKFVKQFISFGRFDNLAVCKASSLIPCNLQKSIGKDL